MEYKADILSMTYIQLEKEMKELKEPSFRTKQIFSWLHEKKITSFEDMTNLSKDLRSKLEEKFYINKIEIENKLSSSVDGTKKYLYRLKDGEFVETVLMKYKYGNSLCISTQVGCKMGCTFCASTVAGYKRNLTVGEMLGQIYETEKNEEIDVNNVVLMGIGEPLDNFDNLIDFLYNLNDKNGKNLSMRNITVSTCGIIDKIEKLMEYNFPINLAISLHAPNQYIRQQTMPITKVHKFDKLIKAGNNYGNKTSRRVTYEYALIKGLNDSEANAKELGKSLKGTLSHVNLISVNEIKEANYKKTDFETANKFKNVLTSVGISTTIRRTLGADIDAACGQLRSDRIS